MDQLARTFSGDARYRQYAQERLTGIAVVAAQAKKHLGADGSVPKVAHGMSLRSIIEPRSLDDSGSMCAAMIKAHRAGIGNELRPWIDNYVQYVSSKQFRLADGTLARNRPLPESLWLDDLYMSVPCLAQAGKLTGDTRYFDDAAKQILQFAERMFVKERGLFRHAWACNLTQRFPWARANGWAIMAMVELLEVLPENHPERAKILELYRTHAAGPGGRNLCGHGRGLGSNVLYVSSRTRAGRARLRTYVSGRRGDDRPAPLAARCRNS